MKVTEAFSKGSPTLSFEFFPPKTPGQEKQLFEVIAQLKKFNPDFVSITYGAMGTTREKSFFWVNEIKTKYKIEPVAHLTCVAATRDAIARQLEELEKMGIENILALRGDPPEGQAGFIPPTNGFKLAKELISFIKERKPSFCVGCAGFPEGHPSAPSLATDTDYLKQKIDAGAEYVITQLFFDNRYYFDFVENMRKSRDQSPDHPRPDADHQPQADQAHNRGLRRDHSRRSQDRCRANPYPGPRTSPVRRERAPFLCHEPGRADIHHFDASFSPLNPIITVEK